MRVDEFRELVDAVFDAKRSLQSATDSEREAEAVRVQLWVRRLRDCQWPKRLSNSDRQKAMRVMDQANAEVASTYQSSSAEADDHSNFGLM